MNANAVLLDILMHNGMEVGEVEMGNHRKRIEFIESYIIKDSDYLWDDNHGELVRCMDCQRRNSNCCPFIEYSLVVPKDDFFCGAGEREMKNEE